MSHLWGTFFDLLYFNLSPFIHSSACATYYHNVKNVIKLLFVKCFGQLCMQSMDWDSKNRKDKGVEESRNKIPLSVKGGTRGQGRGN